MIFSKKFPSQFLAPLSILIAGALPLFSSASQAQAEDDYDRLDGMGKSGKRVNVIEWEGTLEIHVYPKDSTAGLGMKIDEKNNKKVMVIAYRFVENPKQTLVRRAILGIPLQEGFRVYKDPMETEYDKFIVSNNGLSGQMISFKLDATPSQLYPTEYAAAQKAAAASGSGRAPASAPGSANSFKETSRNQPPSPGVDENGTIQPFMMGRSQDR